MKSLVFIFAFLLSLSSYGQTVQENINVRYSPWSITAFSLISSESDQMERGGLLNSYNFVGPNYRINYNERLAFKAAFNANTNGYDRFNGDCGQVQDSSLADPFVEYNIYNLGFMPAVADVFWSGRVYLPMSKPSRQKQMIAQYRSNTIFSRNITQDILVEYRNDVRFYHQSKRTYFGTHSNDQCEVEDNGGPSNTKQFRMENWVSLWYRINNDFSLGFNGIMRDQWYNTSDFETGRQRNGRMQEISFMMGPQLRYNWNYNVSFIVSYRDVVEYSGFHPERQDDLVELGEFRASNTEFSLLSFIRF